jgi:hypothetical protein
MKPLAKTAFVTTQKAEYMRLRLDILQYAYFRFYIDYIKNIFR